MSEAHDDPVVALSLQWQADCDRLEKYVILASRSEMAMLRALGAARVEARLQFREAARTRDELFDRLDQLSRAVFRTPACSFVGVVAKLHVAIRESEPSPTEASLPWPHLRAVRDDLDRLAAAGNESGQEQDGAKSF